MNMGICKATGEWLYFLGTDDALYDAFVLKDIFGSPLKDIEFIYGNVELTNCAKITGKIYDGPFDYEKLLYQSICHQAIFYKRSLIQKIGYYNTKYILFADHVYNLRCLTLPCKNQYIDRVIACYNCGGSSGDPSKDIAFADEKQSILFEYFSPYVSKNQIRLALDKKREYGAYAFIREGYILQGLWECVQLFMKYKRFRVIRNGIYWLKKMNSHI